MSGKRISEAFASGLVGVVEPTDPFLGIPTQVSPMVPDNGRIFVFSDPGLRDKYRKTVVCGPLTMWSINHQGRRPFESAYSLGMSELRREKRRANKLTARSAHKEKADV